MYSFKNWNYQRAKAVISWSALMENHCPIMFLYDTIKHYMFCRIPQRVKDPQNLKGKNMKTALKRKISSVLMVTGGLLLSPISDFPVPGNYFTGHYGFLSNADAAGANGRAEIFRVLSKPQAQLDPGKGDACPRVTTRSWKLWPRRTRPRWPRRSRRSAGSTMTRCLPSGRRTWTRGACLMK